MCILDAEQPPEPLLVYVAIGNSDGKLNQRGWANFWDSVHELITRSADHIHSATHSLPNSPWQNALWCVEVDPDRAQDLREALNHLRAVFRQDSIGWAAATQAFIR